MSATNNVDVVIIGAGFSGLQAALEVQKAGLTFALIEAHDRVGGKSLSIPLTSMDGSVDMGPTWINDQTQPRMFALMNKYNLGIIKQYREGKEVMLDDGGMSVPYPHGELPTGIPPEQLEQLSRILTLIQTEAAMRFDHSNSAQWPNDNAHIIPDISIAEFMAKNDVAPGTMTYSYLSISCRGLFGLEPHEVGMHFFLDTVKQGHGLQSLVSDDSEGAQYLRTKEGTSTLAGRMADELPLDSILLSSPTTSIEQQETLCKVSTQNGYVLSCKKVIVTVPSHTYHYITFSPALPPQKQDLASSTLRGRYTKSVLTYPTPWWRDFGLSGVFHCSHPTKGPITTTWEVSHPDKNQFSLAIFTAADQHTTHFGTNKTSTQRKKAVLDHLALIVGGVVGEEKAKVVYDVREFVEQGWYNKKWIEGAPMAAMKAGDYARLAPVLRESFMHVHFAGTETAREWKGYMEGAVEAGQRAAAEVVEALKK